MEKEKHKEIYVYKTVKSRYREASYYNRIWESDRPGEISPLTD